MKNFLEFSGLFVPELFKNGFVPINFKDISCNEPVLSLYKQEGSVFYITNIYDVDNSVGVSFLKLREEWLKYFKASQDKYNLKYIIYNNIFVSAKENSEVSNYIEDSEEYYAQEVYEINYGVVLDDKKVISSDNQPHNITKVKRLLDSIIISTYDDVEDKNKFNPAIYDDFYFSLKPKVNHAFLTFTILIINAIVLVFMELDGGSENIDVLMKYGAMHYGLFINGEYGRIFTSMFIHIGIMHFLYNSISLYIFGTRVEKYYGTAQFLLIYIISGLLGNFANSFFAKDVVMAGASGSIYGLIGAAFAITMRYKKNLEGLNYYTLGVFCVTGFLIGLTDESVGNIAHLFGLISGYLVSSIMLMIRDKKEKANV